MNPPDSIALLIILALGLLIGSAIGFIAAGLLTARHRRRANIESWNAARRFYERAYILTPKG